MKGKDGWKLGSVVSRPAQYPVVPSFRDWQFPYDYIPAFWLSPNRHLAVVDNASLRGYEYVLRPDLRAYRTERGERLVQEQWHVEFASITAVKAPAGPLSTSSARAEYVVYVLAVHATEFSDLYHDRVVQYLYDPTREYLFARFAWAVLINVKPFIVAGLLRCIARFRIFSGEGADLYKAGRSRSTSFRKRKRGNDDENGLHGYRSINEADKWCENVVGTEEGEDFSWERGRLVKRARIDSISDDYGWDNGNIDCWEDTADEPQGTTRHLDRMCGGL
ncbi:hypothetical protein QBC46DRAFT_451673 [Diplogelasinospora grovesii]|uniref:Uncharacterized protein n=1 Tax=Diplogelasinospora grovesii TaxID=303347 RepID=A0AAN6N3X7_9PEZI|nr:hypothetical protein QBC46DRAFT_451673 [Diplogelasinospora grovesii]